MNRQRLVASVWLLCWAASVIAAASNVKPGDRAYPQANPNPQRLVELRVAIPASLKASFSADYAANVLADAGRCQFSTGVGASAPYFVSVPLSLKKKSGQQVASVAVDAYLPGECGWHLTGIAYRMEGNAPLPPELDDSISGAVARVPEAIWHVDPKKLHQGRVDLWCTEHSTVSNTGPSVSASFQCSSWDTATRRRLNHAIPDDPSRNAPGSDKGDQTTTYIVPDTKTVEVYFHDIEVGDGR